MATESWLRRSIGTVRRGLGLPSPSSDLRLTAPPKTADGVRIYAIGDMHGRLDLYERLITAIERDDAGRGPAAKKLVVLGDFIDRGPDSASLASLLMRLSSLTRSMIVLKGNHEAVMVDVLSGQHAALDFWLEHGGRASVASWGVADELTGPFRERELIAALRSAVGGSMIRWMDELPTSYRSGDYLFVHAGVRPGRPLARQSEQDLLWIREEFLGHAGRHEAVVVHGHTVEPQGPMFYGNRIAIDTGAYRTDRLCAVGLEGHHQWVVNP